MRGEVHPLGHGGGGVRPPGDRTWLRVDRRQFRNAITACGWKEKKIEFAVVKQSWRICCEYASEKCCLALKKQNTVWTECTAPSVCE